MATSETSKQAAASAAAVVPKSFLADALGTSRPGEFNGALHETLRSLVPETSTNEMRTPLVGHLMSQTSEVRDH